MRGSQPSSYHGHLSKYGAAHMLFDIETPVGHRQIVADDEYALFSVVVFKRVHDEFIQKCRENKSV